MAIFCCATSHNQLALDSIPLLWCISSHRRTELVRVGCLVPGTRYRFAFTSSGLFQEKRNKRQFYISANTTEVSWDCNQATKEAQHRPIHNRVFMYQSV